MSMISEQVKELKAEAEWLEKDQEKRLASILLQAADTIESLSTKLQVANMEQPADCGGWVPYDFGENPPKEDGYYWVTCIYDGDYCPLKELMERLKSAKRFVQKVEYRNGSWKMRGIKVIAYMPYCEPEPYREP